MGGGLLAFPLFYALSNYYGLTPFGGPEYLMDTDHHSNAEAFLSETEATFLLAILVFAVNLELNFGKYHYWIKQSLTAVGIRALIEIFPTTGPAMNPMLATTWAAFGVGEQFEFPSHPSHYFIYWVGPCLAAIVASTVYVIYAGGTILGMTLPIGPLKKKKVTAAKKKN
jgi:glycerol uptake facilitator-like aquaporin